MVIVNTFELESLAKVVDKLDKLEGSLMLGFHPRSGYCIATRGSDAGVDCHSIPARAR